MPDCDSDCVQLGPYLNDSSECNVECGEELYETWVRDTVVPAMGNGEKCKPEIFLKPCPDLKKCVPLSETEQVVAAVLQTLGCVWILIILGIELFVLLSGSEQLIYQL